MKGGPEAQGARYTWGCKGKREEGKGLQYGGPNDAKVVRAQNGRQSQSDLGVFIRGFWRARVGTPFVEACCVCARNLGLCGSYLSWWKHRNGRSSCIAQLRHGNVLACCCPCSVCPRLQKKTKAHGHSHRGFFRNATLKITVHGRNRWGLWARLCSGMNS